MPKTLILFLLFSHAVFANSVTMTFGQPSVVLKGCEALEDTIDKKFTKYLDREQVEYSNYDISVKEKISWLGVISCKVEIELESATAYLIAGTEWTGRFHFLNDRSRQNYAKVMLSDYQRDPSVLVSAFTKAYRVVISDYGVMYIKVALR